LACSKKNLKKIHQDFVIQKRVKLKYCENVDGGEFFNIYGEQN
jgi:hypothetical protein